MSSASPNSPLRPLSPPSPPGPSGASAAPNPAAPPDAAAPVRVERRSDGLLSVYREGCDPVQAQAFRCFPWSNPDRHVSLRDMDGNEVALIANLADLDADSRAAVEEALTDASFVFEIEAVESMETEFEICNWKVRTRQGPCTFQTKRQDYPHQMDDGSLVIQDVSKNLYRVTDLDALDRRSRRILWAFMD